MRTSFTAVSGHRSHLGTRGERWGWRELVVAAVVVEGRSKSEVARDYGVSRRWVITLVQRYLAEGDAGLAPRSRRPHRSPNQTSAAIEEEIVEIRKGLDRAGHEAGAATIAAHLERRHGTSPAVSTIWRILTDAGLRRPPAAQATQELLRPLRSRAAQRAVADRHHALGAWPMAPTSRSSTSSMITPGSVSPASPDRVFKAADVDGCFKQAAAAHGDPAKRAL